jgi:hypothetical protein
MKRDDYTARIARFLDQHCIAHRFEDRAKHRAVVITHGGRQLSYIFPASGSDWRGPRQAVSGLRRMLGVSR